MARNWQRHRGYCAWIPTVSQNQKSFPSFTTASLVLAHHSVATLTPRLRHSPFQPLPCPSRCSLQVARNVWSNEDNNRRSNLQCLPAQIVSNNGPPFQSVEYSEFLQQNGIQRILVSSYHPSSNGLAERFVQTFKYALESSVADPAWSCLHSATADYKISPIVQKHTPCHYRVIICQALPGTRPSHLSFPDSSWPC